MRRAAIADEPLKTAVARRSRRTIAASENPYSSVVDPDAVAPGAVAAAIQADLNKWVRSKMPPASDRVPKAPVDVRLQAQDHDSSLSFAIGGLPAGTPLDEVQYIVGNKIKLCTSGPVHGVVPKAVKKRLSSNDVIVLILLGVIGVVLLAWFVVAKFA